MVKVVVRSELPWLEVVVSRATMDGSGSAVVTPGSSGYLVPWIHGARQAGNPRVKGPFLACPVRPLKSAPQTDLPKPAGGGKSHRALRSAGHPDGELYANNEEHAKVA
jgi:hypothetical protein